MPAHAQISTAVTGESKSNLGLLQTKLPKQDTPTAIEDSDGLSPEEKEELKREAERASIFQKVSNDVLEVPNGYRKVEVLILRWHESIDDFQGHNEEIKRLKRIFEYRFGYNCTVETIRNNSPPQLGLNRAIAWHVEQHYEEDTLLIVYYTGHGNKLGDNNGGQPLLQLSATDDWNSMTGAFPPTATWNEAEKPLIKYAQGDVLVILDCCFASMAAWKGMTEGIRAYQLLAASAVEGRTSGPGETSFTNALCQSLEELRCESEGDCFPVIKLMERINKIRLTQGAYIWDRLCKYRRQINLGPLDHSQEREESFRKQDPEKASLLLQFSLKTADLQDSQIKSLARKLPEMCKELGVPVRQIQWVRMEERDQEHTIRKVLSALRRNVAAARTPRPGMPSTLKVRVEPKRPSHVRNVRMPSRPQSRTRRTTARASSRSFEIAAWKPQHQEPPTQKLYPAIWTGDRPWFYVLKALTMIGLLLAVPYSIEDRLKLVLLAVCIALVWLQNPGAVRKLDERVELEAQKCSAVSESIVYGLHRAGTF